MSEIRQIHSAGPLNGLYMQHKRMDMVQMEYSVNGKDWKSWPQSGVQVMPGEMLDLRKRQSVSTVKMKGSDAEWQPSKHARKK